MLHNCSILRMLLYIASLLLHAVVYNHLLMVLLLSHFFLSHLWILSANIEVPLKVLFVHTDFPLLFIFITLLFWICGRRFCWVDNGAGALTPLSGRVFSFTDSCGPVWLRKDDEWVSGGWSRWAALGKQIPPLLPSLQCWHDSSIVVWKTRACRQGAEHAALMPMQI